MACAIICPILVRSQGSEIRTVGAAKLWRQADAVEQALETRVRMQIIEDRVLVDRLSEEREFTRVNRFFEKSQRLFLVPESQIDNGEMVGSRRVLGTELEQSDDYLQGL